MIVVMRRQRLVRAIAEYHQLGGIAVRCGDGSRQRDHRD